METLIRRRLLTSNFAKSLATFNDEPAIFYAKAPDDISFNEIYPHAILTLDKFSDAIHGVAGILTVEIICTQTSTSTPERLEISLRQSLEGVFFTPADGEIFALKWQKADVFQEPASERLPLIVGAVSIFEVREFPSTETASPDPIQALNFWANRFDERLIVIGLTETPGIFEPSFDAPAIYFDAQRTRMTAQTYASIGLETLAVGHIFARGLSSRRRWTAAIANGILSTKAIFLADGSPMRLTACEQIFAADEIQGQLQLTFEFGMLKSTPYAHPLVSKVTDFNSILKRTCKNQQL